MTAEPTGAQWSARYDAGDTPWDLGRAHPMLVSRLSDDPGLGSSPGRALVPGCGRGHDALALADAGWEVTALDLAPALEPLVAPLLAQRGGRFVLGDALDPAVACADGRRFDLVFDHTFFCAIPLHRRPDFAALCDQVLTPQGRLVSVVFPIGRDHAEGGPPFGMSVDQVGAVLGRRWATTEVTDESTLAGRGWPQRWARWERTAPD